MSKLLLSRFLLASVALLLASSAFAQSRRGYVRLTRIGPTVEVQDNKGEKEKMTVLEETRILEQNTVITVGAGSRVILVFSNGATLNVKENSTLNIETFRQDPFAGQYDLNTATDEPEARSTTKIFLKEGELIGNVKSLRPESTFTVATPAGAAGIRGTTFRVVFRPSGTGQAFFSVTTLEGDVGVTTTEGTVDAPISVVDDQEVVIVVEVDDETGAVTVVTPIEEIAPATADPAVLADMTQAVQESVEAVVNVVMSAETDQDETPVTDEGDEGEGNDEGAAEEESDEESEENSEETEQSEEAEQTDEGESADENTTPDSNDSSDDGANDSTTGESDSNDGSGSTDNNLPPTTPPVDNTDNPSSTQGSGGGGG